MGALAARFNVNPPYLTRVAKRVAGTLLVANQHIGCPLHDPEYRSLLPE